MLALALVWSGLIRVPLVLNAATHLDSDLAVDGLTILEATQGHWRWHYPGTPYMGTTPVLLSWPQALIGGVNPVTLVSGGAVAALALTLATFGLAWRSFGPGVAAWSLVPLTFASTGALWLSGRVTGGHLLTAAWHAGAFALLFNCLTRGGLSRIAAFGVWCGLGLYLDSMFLATLAGLIPAAVGAWWRSGRSWGEALRWALVVPAFLVGCLPREAGRRLEPHDAYREQFEVMTRRDVLASHARILALDCLPRLVAGHRLPGLQADPDPAALAGGAPLLAKADSHPLAIALTGLALALFAIALGALVRSALAAAERSQRAVSAGLLLSSLVVTVGFITNRNIYNSDNYRYLVTLLVPWSVGFGLALRGLARRGRGGFVAALLCASTVAGLMTLDTARWYARFGWIDERGRPVRKPLDDPAFAWLDRHREFESISGGYWDVYRLAFLTSGRVRGVPFPVYPDRFPEWSRDLHGGHPPVLFARPTPEGRVFAERALQAGGEVLYQARGLTIISRP